MLRNSRVLHGVTSLRSGGAEAERRAAPVFNGQWTRHMLAPDRFQNLEFTSVQQQHMDPGHKIPDERNLFPANRFHVGFRIGEWKYGMVDHQEILSAVTITRHGSRTDNIQKLDS